MAGPWDEYRQATPAGSLPWEEYAQTPSRPPTKPYRGSMLPFSRGPDGKVSFDSNAGILGSIKRAVTLPGEVYRGEIDPKSDEGIARSFEMGSVVTPINPAVRSGGYAIPGQRTDMVKGSVSPPSAQALKDAGGAGYTAAREMGVEYSPQSVASVATGLRTALDQEGMLANLAPKSAKIIDDLSVPPQGATSVPFSGIEAARRGFGFAGKDFTNPTEQIAASRAQAALDDFVTANDPASIVAGTAAAPRLAQVITDARGNYAAAMRSEKIRGIEEAAELRSAVANSGTNSDNAVRQRIASLLLSPKQSAGFSEGEIAALEGVAKGSAGRNTMRFIGNLLGGGGGLGAVASGATGGATGAALGGPIGAAVGAAVPAIGMTAKMAANKMTDKALSRADESIRMRSPLYQQMLENAPMVPADQNNRAALIRALIQSEQNKNNVR